MDFSNYTHEGQDGFLTEQKESHWQPALRPNDEEMDDTAPQSTILEVNKSPEMDGSKPASDPAYRNDENDEGSSSEDENGRLDPAWGIKRTDSAHILDTVRRSTSFPRPTVDFSTFSPSTESWDPSQTQMFDENANLDRSSQFRRLIEHDEGQDDQEFLHNAYQIATLDQDMGVSEEQSTSPGQEESRYDEGIPLMQGSNTAESAVSKDPPTTPSVFENVDVDNNGADDFFAQMESNPLVSTTGNPTLERKHTEDVLTDLGLRRTAPDSPLGAHPQLPNDSQELHKEKDLAAAFATVDENEDDPWKAALGGDDDFLIEDADDLLPDSDSEPEAVNIPATSEASIARTTKQAGPVPQRPNSNMYAPHQPSTSELTRSGTTTYNSVGLPRQAPNPMNAFQTPQQPPNITNRAASYVDQSKGGYKSPYDLPLDLAPKRKAQAQRTLPQLNNIPPPPRSSSINTEKQLQSPFTPAGPTFNQSTAASPITAVVPAPVDRSASVPVRGPPPSKRPSSGFFEELPMAPRARPSPVIPRNPVVQTPAGPPRQASHPAPNLVASPPQIPIQEQAQQQDQYAQYQLHQPEKLDPYANLAAQTPQVAQTPAMNSRYSPAPPPVQGMIKPSPSPRYSPAPPTQTNGGHSRYVSQPLSGSSNLPFQPRTSSPLAHQRTPVERAVDPTTQNRPGMYHSTSSSVPYTTTFSQAASNTLSPPRAMDPTKQPDFAPPRRSQTQSPSRQKAKPNLTTRIAPAPNRPASAIGQLSPTRTTPAQSILSPPRLVPQQRFVEEVDYIKPNNGTETDPLERWKGTPIFNFGFGGTIVSSFPRRTPRFSSAATRPQIKISPGEVTIKKSDDIVAVKEHVKKFPGPLKGKAKKKDVLVWMASTISGFETEAMSFPSKRLEEKILLWKIMRIFVEQDGNFTSGTVVQHVSEVLMPSIHVTEDQSSSQQRAEDPIPGIYRPASVAAKTETVDPVAVESLRKMLLKGKREDAVWQAVDNRLWSHALLLSSTLDKSVWKQVVQEFVKQEVKTIGTNSESLCALYEILGGNLEESVDQLVPPSARAGLQMVSKIDTSGPTRNALDGMDKWRETLCLVLNNRTHEDQRALLTLGRLLSDYGRTEAAHICYLFARDPSIPNMFGGADDPATHIVLVGADHRQQPLSFHNDVDAILLSEVFEYTVSTLASGSAGAPMPHLAVYKLQRANELTDAGMKTEAQAYCESIASGLKSNTKHSLYYHPILLGEVEDLSNRLKQIPVQSSSWIAKPSIEKASNSVWNKFSSFVTGEDSDAESKGSARDHAESGPFANVSGSPTLSRNTSQTDLYGSYPLATQTAAPTTTAGSRYAPNGVSSNRSSSDFNRGRMSFESQRSPPSTSHSNEGRGLYAPNMQPQHNQYSPLGVSPQAAGYQPNMDLHMPPVAEERPAPQYNAYTPQVAPIMSNGTSEPSYGIYQPMDPAPELEQDTSPEVHTTFEPSQNNYGGYQPPEDAGYVPYQPEPESDNESDRKPKKSAMDEDANEDFERGSSPSKTTPPSTSGETDDPNAAARRKANDEAADAAFRAAAEADAKAATEAKSSKKASGSWLGGWFSGGKKPDSLDASSSSKSASNQKVHRVHLGESKMKLYYDENKKKWINPDNPEASEKKTLAPPPRGSTGSAPPPMAGLAGPPRSVSTPHSLPVGGISRSGTPASVAVDSDGPDSRPGSSHIAPSTGFAATLPPGTKESLGLGGTPLPTPPGSSSGPTSAGLGVPGGPSGPPSRPASALSNASGLDDLLGAPTGARKVSGRTAKGKKGRYVDVMAK